MTTVSIMQPAYLPWLGYFDRIAKSDIHIVLDSVQLEKGTKTQFTNRNRVRTAQGWSWLTVPISGRFGERTINSVRVAGDEWARKHWETLRQNYGRTPYFATHAEYFEEAYSSDHERLIDVIDRFSSYLLRTLGLETTIMRSSAMAARGSKDEALVALCKEVGATAYISGPFGRDYLRAHLFEEAGISLLFHDYHHPVYPQAYKGFEANLSVVDLLFNVGDGSLKVITNAQGTMR